MNIKIKQFGLQFNEWLVLGFLFIARLFSMVAIPLNDSTEARYGEIARKMLTTGDWITLWHYPGVPFWGKPPFSIWLSAFSMKLFGISALAARLPSLLLSVLVLFLVCDLVRAYRSLQVMRICLFVLASSFIFYLASGTVMMDPALVFSVTLCQVSFWKAAQKKQQRDGYLFFLGLAIGLLAKGPIVLILVGGSIGLWTIWKRQWLVLWQALPWVGGMAMMLLIALPWYILAEQKTPGFLNYFIVGEHFARFFQSAWQGDKYGFAHAHMFGIIWLYALCGTMPWSIVLFIATWKAKFRRTVVDTYTQNEKSWVHYWSVCLLFPLLFFTFAKNLIYPYTLPIVPAFSILFAEVWTRYQGEHLDKNLILKLASSVGLFFIIASALFYYFPQDLAKSEQRMVNLWQHAPGSERNPLAYWKHSLAFSGFFYSQGNLLRLATLTDICQMPHPKDPIYFVVNSQMLDDLQTAVHGSIKKIGQIKTRNEVDFLVRAEQVDVTC